MRPRLIAATSLFLAAFAIAGAQLASAASVTVGEYGAPAVTTPGEPTAANADSASLVTVRVTVEKQTSAECDAELKVEAYPGEFVSVAIDWLPPGEESEHSMTAVVAAGGRFEVHMIGCAYGEGGSVAATYVTASLDASGGTGPEGKEGKEGPPGPEGKAGVGGGGEVDFGSEAKAELGQLGTVMHGDVWIVVGAIVGCFVGAEVCRRVFS